MRGGASIRRTLCALAVAIGAFAVPGAASASVADFAMAVQPDGKVLLAGGSGRIGGAASGKEVGAVVRYEADGNLDRSFGDGDGVALLRQLEPFTALALQPDGRILLTSHPGRLSRLLANGRLDPSFGVGGMSPPGALSAYYPTSVASIGAAGILVGGMTGYLEDPAEHLYGRLYLYPPDGLSSQWVGSMTSGDGRVGEPKTYLNDFVVGRGGKVVGAGTAAAREPGARTQAALARLLPAPDDGVYPTGPDPSFGAGAGLVRSSFFPASPAPELANALSLHKGRLLIAGQADGQALVARYSGSGALDTHFGRAGAATTRVRTSSVANALATPTAGGILSAGGSAYGCGAGSCEGLLLARYKGNGRPDRRFGGGDGIVSPGVDTGTYGTPASEVAYGVAGPKGAVLVGGLLTTPGSSRFFLRRYLADGTPDGAFGDRGRVTTLPLVAGTPAPGSGR
jgi:uncharacterized delta-60 repeat protein